MDRPAEWVIPCLFFVALALIFIGIFGDGTHAIAGVLLIATIEWMDRR